jgi:hypothetical protein
MPSLKQHLRQLTQELAGVEVNHHRGSGEISELEAKANGDLDVHLKTGRTLTIPRVASYLTPTLLSGAVQIARSMRKRGIIGTVINLVKLTAFFLLLILITAVVLVVMGVRALLRK